MVVCFIYDIYLQVNMFMIGGIRYENVYLQIPFISTVTINRQRWCGLLKTTKPNLLNTQTHLLWNGTQYFRV